MVYTPRFIELNGNDLQRLAEVDLGTQAAARFARDFPINQPMRRGIISVVTREVKKQIPVDTGRLKNSLRSIQLGDRIQWYWMWYGSIITRGIPNSYTIAAQNRPSGNKSRRHSLCFMWKKLGLPSLSFFISVTHPPLPPRPFVRAGIREAQIYLDPLLNSYGNKLFRIIREVPGYSVDDELDAEILGGVYGEYVPQ